MGKGQLFVKSGTSFNKCEKKKKEEKKEKKNVEGKGATELPSSKLHQLLQMKIHPERIKLVGECLRINMISTASNLLLQNIYKLEI